MNGLYLRWVDSASVNAGLWTSRDEIRPSALTQEGLLQETVGFVVDESADAVMVAQSRSVEDDVLGAVLSIPRRSIVEMREWST